MTVPELFEAHSRRDSTTLRQLQTQQSITNNRLSFELAARKSIFLQFFNTFAQVSY
jgi:hypothetical protein